MRRTIDLALAGAVVATATIGMTMASTSWAETSAQQKPDMRRSTDDVARDEVHPPPSGKPKPKPPPRQIPAPKPEPEPKPKPKPDSNMQQKSEAR